MVLIAFVTLLAVSAAPPQTRPAGATFPRPLATHVGAGVRAVRTAHRTAPTGWRGETLPAPSDAYSVRARRRFAAYLRLRLLEMREAGLERAAAVVERRLPVDALVPPLRDGREP